MFFFFSLLNLKSTFHEMNIKLKEFVRSLVCFTSTYKKTRCLLEAPFDEKNLSDAVYKAIANVPFYRSHNYLTLLRNDGKFDLSVFPLLQKREILGHEIEFVSDRFSKLFLRREKTGGTTGMPMALFYSPKLSIQRTVMPDILIEKYAPHNSQVAMMRGVKPKNNSIYQRIGKYKLAFSSYLICEENVDDYLNALRKEDVAIITAYPSAITVFASHIKNKYGKCPAMPLKAIITSSEIFDRNDKDLVMSTFPGVKLIDFYSMSEFVTAAYSIGLDEYHFNMNYGYVEFLDTNDKTLTGNRICKIVATSIMNDTMPLIRYDTGDLAELDDKNSVISIIGRVNHYAVNKNDELVPCIVIFSDEPVRHTLQYQYYQDTPGVLEVRVLPKTDFTEEDRLTMIRDMEECFLGTMLCKVSIVDTLEHTSIGKLSRMIQKLDLMKYKKRIVVR